MAFKLGNQPVAGYPMPLGDKYLVEFDHTGPASYAQFVTPNTGGDVVKANGGGLNFGGFDDMDINVDTSGQIAAYPVRTLAGYGNAVPQITLIYYSLVTASVGGQNQTAGTQVVAATNLSTLSWRCQAIMV